MNARPCLVVVKALGLVTVQRQATYARIHQGLPPGGPLVPSLLARANRRIENREDDGGIEVCGELVVRAVGDVLVGTDREARLLAAGDEMTIASGPRRAAYVTVIGGVEGPPGMLSSTYVAAGIGGVLRANDGVCAGPTLLREPRIIPLGDAPAAGEVIRVIAGPDPDAFTPEALALLEQTAWRIQPTSDRVGTRLAGATLPRRPGHVEQSRPMVIGAIEVPRDGAPIVLGPEHPTTGGYPILAVVASDALDAFHTLPLGARVRFTLR